MAGDNVVGTYVDRITTVPGRFVDEGGAIFVRVAERNGGSMMGKRLSARVTGRAVSEDSGSATVVGSPAAQWALREDGAKVHMIAPHGRTLAGGLSHPVNEPVRHPGFAGEERWTHTVEQVRAEIDRLAQELAGQAAS